jgi:uncharacterized protein (DUF1800 family)
MTVRINGSVIASVEVRAATFTDYNFTTPLRAADKVDIAFTNDAQIGGADRNLYIAYLSDGHQVLLPTMTGALIDRGSGARAFDGLDTVAAQGTLWSNGALRLTWPAAPVVDAAALAKRQAAVRFLMQASFGPTPNAIEAVLNQDYAGWVTQQVAQPYTPDFVNYIQAKYALGDAWRPKGSSYTSEWVGRKFWASAARAPDQLRKRTAFALHQILMVSQADSNLYHHSRAYAAYMDVLNKHAFGNFRNLLEDIALSPAMGIYLSHMRNRKEDPASGRMPDENFARELMQLFTIGLHELNSDGTVVRNAAGQPVETYNNADVMALARVFTGWSWAFPDAQMTDSNFRWGGPNYSAAADTGIDLLPMKPYPTQHSSAEKRLFAGKPWAVTIAANGTARSDLKTALDTLFNHPNVGPFIGRQLIQRLVSSNPSPAYVGRVAAVFANNGAGVRGDLGAVVRAIVLDSEARASPAGGAAKLREPVLRVSHWMRALGARSSTGDYAMAWELESAGQRALNAASVFSYFRPGYVPPNTPFAAAGATAPEFQILNESTAAGWINSAEAMAGWGLGWTGSTSDITVDYAGIGALTSSGNLRALVDHLDLLLLGGRMSPTLRQAVLDATGGATDSGSKLLENRARAAVFVVLASPEFATQP